MHAHTAACECGQCRRAGVAGRLVATHAGHVKQQLHTRARTSTRLEVRMLARGQSVGRIPVGPTEENLQPPQVPRGPAHS